MKKQIVRLLCMVMAMMLLTMSCGLAETLRLNSSGDGVKNLQTALKQLGFYAGGVDGKYGYVTQKSVKNFQAAYGLSADGVAGNATQTKLEALTGIEITDNTPVSTPAPAPTSAPVADEQPGDVPQGSIFDENPYDVDVADPGFTEEDAMAEENFEKKSTSDRIKTSPLARETIAAARRDFFSKHSISFQRPIFVARTMPMAPSTTP